MAVSLEASVVDTYFRAMEKGPAEVEELVDLFSDAATYVEPFTGSPVEHQGKKGIRAYFEECIPQSPPDLRVTVDRIDIDGDRVTAEWTCTASAFPGPMRGRDQFHIVDGKIARLETIMIGA